MSRGGKGGGDRQRRKKSRSRSTKAGGAGKARSSSSDKSQSGEAEAVKGILKRRQAERKSTAARHSRRVHFKRPLCTAYATLKPGISNFDQS